MALRNRDTTKLLALILFQGLCLVFFVGDVIGDVVELGMASLTSVHVLPEAGATLGLMGALTFETRYLMRMMQRQAHMEQGLGIAAGELASLMEGYFRQWGLTSSEQDIATFTIKGYTIAEVAEMRESAEATVKTHLNAIYRKAGVSGRGQLVSLLIEDLMRAPLAELSRDQQELANRVRRGSGENS